MYYDEIFVALFVAEILLTGDAADCRFFYATEKNVCSVNRVCCLKKMPQGALNAPNLTRTVFVGGKNSFHRQQELFSFKMPFAVTPHDPLIINSLKVRSTTHFRPIYTPSPRDRVTA